MGKSEGASWKEPGVSTGRQDDADEAAEYGFRNSVKYILNYLRVELTIRASSVVANLSPSIFHFHYKIRVVNK
jgi:hypothetical protein